jgi:glycosyltransferase involved in cell wall biosynthesis
VTREVTTGAPFFSVVIPMFNRAAFISRSIESCLRQSEASLEIIVVDDGSTDGSAEIVERCTDSRVRLFRQPSNQGQCPARNRGASESRGRWLVFLDSDDELAERALHTLRRRIDESPGSVHKILSMCRWSTGQVSPEPPLTGAIWDYRGYVSWLESVYGRPSECLPCVRRDSFLALPYPDGHSAEAVHDLDFARRHHVRGCGDIARLFHRDAHNNFGVMPARRLLQIAPFYAANAEDILARHGAALAELAPRRLNDVLASATLNQFLAGRRARALRRGVALLRRRPTSLATWAVIVAGLIGAGPLARLRELRDRLSARRAAT